MIRNIIRFCCVLLMCWGQITFANSGPLFNIKTDGTELQITSTIPDHFYPRAGIKINTPGYTFAYLDDECTLNDKGFCVFPYLDNLDITYIDLVGRGGIIDVTLCLDADGPVSCQNFKNVDLQLAYITNLGDNSASVCGVNTDGGITPCATLNTESPVFDTLLDYPAAIILNPKKTIAYIVNYHGLSVTVCPINSSGLFDTCLQNFGFNFSYGGAAFSANGNFIYLSMYDNPTSKTICGTNATSCTGSIQKCSISPENGTIVLDSCVDSGAGNVPFEHPIGVTLNKAGTLAYITNDTPGEYIEICSVNTTTGNFSNCHRAIEECTQDCVNAIKPNHNPAPGSLSGPIQIVLNNAETFAYITNYNSGFVTKCQLSNDRLHFSSCADSGAVVPPIFDIIDGGLGGNSIWGIALNELKSTVYIGNTYDTNLWECTILENGDFSTCGTHADDNNSFNQTAAIALT